MLIPWTSCRLIHHQALTAVLNDFNSWCQAKKKEQLHHKNTSLLYEWWRPSQKYVSSVLFCAWKFLRQTVFLVLHNHVYAIMLRRGKNGHSTNDICAHHQVDTQHIPETHVPMQLMLIISVVVLYQATALNQNLITLRCNNEGLTSLLVASANLDLWLRPRLTL